MISNGWLATEKKLLELKSLGLTGVAFSLDSNVPSILQSNRDMSESQIKRSLTNFEKISKSRINGEIKLELGNSVSERFFILGSYFGKTRLGGLTLPAGFMHTDITDN